MAHICPRVNYHGGTERFAREVNRAMNQLGIESTVYSCDFMPNPSLLSGIAVSAMLSRKAVRDGFDTLVFHKGQAASQLFKKIRAICYLHQSKYYDLTGTGPLGEIYKNLLFGLERGFNEVVCNSYYAASRIRRIMPHCDVKVVYPGVRVEPSVLKNPGDEPLCYYYSRFHPQKNQDFLLQIFEKLPFKLILSGGTWDYRFAKYHRKLIERASAMVNVRINPDIDEKLQWSLLSRCSVFLFPAIMESFGIVLLEAMAFGKPIIALDSGASPEVLGDAGILCGDNIEDWRIQITRLLSNDELRSSLSKESLRRARNFSWERTAKDLVTIIQNA